MTSSINQDTARMERRAAELFTEQVERTESTVATNNRIGQKDLLAKANAPVDATLSGKGPLLINPQGNPDTTELTDSQSLIAIISYALSLQMRSQSDFWKMAWQQAGQNMQIFAEFAPLLSSATQGDYNAQAAQSENQGEEARQSGWLNLGGATMALGTAAFTSFTEDAAKPNEVVAEDPEESEAARLEKLNEEAPAPKPAAGGAAADPAEAAEDDAAANQKANQEEQKLSRMEQLKRGASSAMGGFKSFMTKYGDVMVKAAQQAQMAQMFSQGITGVFITPKFQNMIAQNQIETGHWKAVEAQCQQLSSWQQMAFGRTEDVRQGASQNIDFGYNLLTSIMDNLAQTTRSIFQG